MARSPKYNGRPQFLLSQQHRRFTKTIHFERTTGQFIQRPKFPAPQYRLSGANRFESVVPQGPGKKHGVQKVNNGRSPGRIAAWSSICQVLVILGPNFSNLGKRGKITRFGYERELESRLFRPSWRKLEGATERPRQRRYIRLEMTQWRRDFSVNLLNLLIRRNYGAFEGWYWMDGCFGCCESRLGCTKMEGF